MKLVVFVDTQRDHSLRCTQSPKKNTYTNREVIRNCVNVRRHKSTDGQNVARSVKPCPRTLQRA